MLRIIIICALLLGIIWVAIILYRIYKVDKLEEFREHLTAYDDVVIHGCKRTLIWCRGGKVCYESDGNHTVVSRDLCYPYKPFKPFGDVR